MSQLIEVKVPDIGDFDAVPVIELFVKVGDTIAVDDAIATLESDKATMDVPSSHAGVVKEVLVGIGDKVAEGTVLIKVEAAGAAQPAAPAPAAARPLAPGAAPAAGRSPLPCCRPAPAAGGVVEVKVPDIGDFDAVPVIELFVKVGDTIKVDDAIATLESDKATMDVPSSAAGVVKEVLVSIGDKVGEGSVLIKVETTLAVGGSPARAAAAAPAAAAAAAAAPSPAPLADGGPAASAPASMPCSAAAPRRSSSAARCTPAPRCAPLPASSASISARSRPPVPRVASSRKTSPPSSRAR